MKTIAQNAILAALLMLGATAFAQQPAYHQTAKIDLPGDGKWDYLKMDEDKHRLFISHFDKVQVVDIATGKPAGEITGLNGVHGIALVKKAGKGYITNGTTNTLTVFDYSSLKVLTTIPVNVKKPDCIIYDEFSGNIYAFGNGSGEAAVIDVKADKEIKVIPIGGESEFAVADGKGMIYNNLEDKSEIVAIDVKAGKVTKRYSLDKNEGPTGIAMDEAHQRLFAVCAGSKTLAVLDAVTGKVIASLPIGPRVDAVIYDKAMKTIIASNGDGTATIILQQDADHYTVAGSLATRVGMRTLTFDKNTHQLFFAGSEMDGKTIKPGTFSVWVFNK